MDVLDSFATRLRRYRLLSGLAVLAGMAVTGYLIAFSPSSAGFALAGPLVITPWAVFCMAVASQPSRQALLGMALFGLAGLAWPLLFL